MRKKKRRVRKRLSNLAFKQQIAQELSRKTGVPYDVHHRHPRSRRRSYKGRNINEDRNLVVLPTARHRAWHTLVGNQLPTEWVKEINDTCMPPDWYLVAVPRKKPARTGRRKRRYCDECNCEVLQHIPAKCKC